MTKFTNKIQFFYGTTWHDKVPFLAEYVKKMENTTIGKATLDTYLTEANQ